MTRKQYLLFSIATLPAAGEWRVVGEEGSILGIDHFSNIAPQLVRLPCVKLPDGTVCAVLEVDR